MKMKNINISRKYIGGWRIGTANHRRRRGAAAASAAAASHVWLI
jgi:hypothetical protein